MDRKKARLLALGYRLVDIWECEWKHLKDTDPEVASFVADLDLQAPLEPCEAFYGGRTNATRLYHNTVHDEKIQYDDYTSLNPWVKKYGKYLVGHPTILYEPNTYSGTKSSHGRI